MQSNRELTTETATTRSRIRIHVGTYEPGIKAIRIQWDVRVLRWPSGELISGSTFQGHDPPQVVEMKGYERSETETGSYPHGAYSWLDEMIAR